MEPAHTRIPWTAVLRRSAAVLAALAVAWLTVCMILFYAPATEPVRDADAVIVLAGASAERLPKGRELQDAGRAPVLALSSTGMTGNADADALCRTDPLPEDVRCFSPSPPTTRGEARSVARLVRDNNWDTVLVVTSRYHAVRAGTLIGQCSRAQVILVATDPGLSPLSWLGRFVEESVAHASSFLRPACSSRI